MSAVEGDTEETEKELAVEEEKNKVDLNPQEKREVRQRKSIPARVVHEVVRQQGIEELERPVMSLLWSGIAAGARSGCRSWGLRSWPPRCRQPVSGRRFPILAMHWASSLSFWGGCSCSLKVR